MWAIMPMLRMCSLLFISLRIFVVCLNLGMALAFVLGQDFTV
jgi:hypothetical protein